MTETEHRSATHPLKGLGLGVLMGLALLVLSFIRRLGDMDTEAFRNGMIDNMLEVGVWGTALSRNILLFVSAMIVVHIAFGILFWIFARASEYAFPRVSASRKQWVALWGVGLTGWLLIANSMLFRHSSLGEPYTQAVRAGGVFNLFHIASVLLICAVTALVVAMLVRAASTVRANRKPSARVAYMVCGALAALGIAVAYASHSAQPVLSKPHVIIIGIDSLRYDVASERGPHAHAPNVRKFLDGAVSFSDAITPLARTFPSWVAILTGRDPHTTGAVVNLLPRSLVHTGDTLGDLYRKAGYRTVYGIDEVRFSNVDETYGFDETITPPIGASDFLLGWFGDTPLSNIIVNSRLGALMFPHLYANRADATTYEPDEFVARLDRKLRFDRPTFLAVHLTLAHWPYGWASSGKIAKKTGEIKRSYGMAVQRVDRQFGDLLAVLERRGALKNALVVVLSDHGEGLGQPDDVLMPRDGMLRDVELGEMFGHGTSVMSPHQWQVLLSMRTFGAAQVKLSRGAVIDAPVTVEDLAPTLTEISALSTRDAFDGQSLMPVLRNETGAADALRKRVRFTETEFNPKGVAIGVATTTSALANASLYYRVDPRTDRLEVRPEHLNEVLSNRQYGAVLGDQVLAAIPRDAETSIYELFLMRRDGTLAQRITTAPDAKAEPQAAQLWASLHDRLGLTQAIEVDADEGDAKP